MSFNSVYLGHDSTKNLNDGYKYHIESVRIPEERLRLYQRGDLVGPHDIALIRLTEDVKFTPLIIAPVSTDQTKKKTTKLLH